MECKNCKYYRVDKYTYNDKEYVNEMCDISHVCDTTSCSYITSDKEVENMDICYNCKHWIGSGCLGFNCKMDYYHYSVNGFDKACEQFEKK